MKKEHQQKLIRIEPTKEDWKKFSLWGRFGMRVAQVIGLLEIRFK